MTNKVFNNFIGTIKVLSVVRDLQSNYSPNNKMSVYSFDTEKGKAVFYATPGKNPDFIKALDDALEGKNSGEFENCTYAVSEMGRTYVEASPYFRIVDNNKAA